MPLPVCSRCSTVWVVTPRQNTTNYSTAADLPVLARLVPPPCARWVLAWEGQWHCPCMLCSARSTWTSHGLWDLEGCEWGFTAPWGLALRDPAAASEILEKAAAGLLSVSNQLWSLKWRSISSVWHACAREGKTWDDRIWHGRTGAALLSCGQLGCGNPWQPPKAVGEVPQKEILVSFWLLSSSCLEHGVLTKRKSSYCSCILCVQECYRKKSESKRERN